MTPEVRAGSGWANIYWHGWLFDALVRGAGEGGGAGEGDDPYAAQRFPLVGVWPRTATGAAEWTEDAAGGGGGGGGGAGAALGDARAGWNGRLRPADQHIHKVDPYAGGTREGTIALYLEAGMDRETAEAAVLGAELECDSYHIGSDSARARLSAGAVAWAVCVDLDPSRARARARAGDAARRRAAEQRGAGPRRARERRARARARAHADDLREGRGDAKGGDAKDGADAKGGDAKDGADAKGGDAKRGADAKGGDAKGGTDAKGGAGGGGDDAKGGAGGGGDDADAAARARRRGRAG